MIKTLVIHFNAICCFGDCYEITSLTFRELISFSFLSIVWVSILLTYYNLIPKSKPTEDQLNNPIYQSTDILLQSKSDDINFVIAKKSTSTLVKVLAFILVLYILFNPLNQYLNFDFYY